MVTLTDDVLQIEVAAETETEAKRLFNAAKRKARQEAKQRESFRQEAENANRANLMGICRVLDRDDIPPGWTDVAWNTSRDYGRALAKQVKRDGSYTVIPVHGGEARFYAMSFLWGIANATGIIAAKMRDSGKDQWFLVAGHEGEHDINPLPACIAKMLEDKFTE